uniref:Uncharacterized protein n=1 Tax=Anguilla anguilla TaxID=7936 RepID=A0A0E9STP1_ANGAN
MIAPAPELSRVLTLNVPVS